MSNQDERIFVRGTGSYAPEKVLTNEDISKFVDTTDEWIVTRTGIRERRIAADDEATSDMAVKAARKAIKMAKIELEAIDAIIIATLTPDMLFPSTACLVQKELGLGPIPAFDVDAACSGFVYGLEVARGILKGNPAYRNVLLVGAEKLSSIIDWEDRSTCVLFGDAAGAVVLSKDKSAGGGELLGVKLGADGNSAPLIHMPGGGSKIPATRDSVDGRKHFLKMNGREVFKLAVRAMVKGAYDILEQCEVKIEDVGCVIPHQANIRIIESVAQHMKLPMSLFPNNLHLYGNTSAASVPLALDEAIRGGRIKDEEYVVMIAFGAGLTWGSTLMKWNTPQ
ncbi:MAG: beta-ketoacyl-ACP synthase III [Verrucomicrobiota bacterium]